MNVANGETYSLKLVERIMNSAYEYEDHITLEFKGRPASPQEKKTYRIQKGVNGGSDSIYIYCSNLPADIKAGDSIIFLGKQWKVESTGFYLIESRVVNAGIMSDEYLISKCPKGLTLQ